MDDRVLDDLYNIDSQVFYQKSKRNLKFASFFLVVAIFTILLSFNFGFLSEIWSTIGGVLMLIATVLSGIGLVNGVKSFRKKEDPSSGRILVFLGNLLIFGLFMWSIILSFIEVLNAIDLGKSITN